MATAVESPSIASAKERAASILYGNEKPVEPVIAEYNVPVKEEPKPEPKFSSYYRVEPIRTKRPTEYRAYEPVYESTVTQEPRVVRPFLDANEATVIAETTVVTPTEAAPVAVTSKAVKSEIDAELEEDTQYVVKFKKSTIIAAAAVAAVFVLLAILFIVNIVSLSTAMGEINGLRQEEQTLQRELDDVLRETEAARRQAVAQIDTAAISASNYVVTVPVAEPVSATITETNGGFFDWLCKSLSTLFG